MASRLHQAVTLIKIFAILKLYLLRVVPTHLHDDHLARFYDIGREMVSVITNISFLNFLWTVVTLPVSSVGLGIRKTQDIALPVFISSLIRSEP